MVKKMMKRGPGRPPKTEKTTAAPQKKRGRKPGIKNKSFLEKVSVLADAVETASLELQSTIDDACELEHDGDINALKALTNAAGMAHGLGETLTGLLEQLTGLPAEFAPGKKISKVLAWEKGNFVIFTHPDLKALMPDAYEITGVMNMGRGPGNGLLIQTEKGLFPKGQLELVDATELAEPTPPAPRRTSPEKRSEKNGHMKAPAPEVLAKAEEMVDADDLNA